MGLSAKEKRLSSLRRCRVAAASILLRTAVKFLRTRGVLSLKNAEVLREVDGGKVAVQAVVTRTRYVRRGLCCVKGICW